jgi:hypothetical protein
MSQRVAQRGVPAALGRMADHVFLAEPLGADHDVIGHVRSESTKLRSVALNSLSR